MEISIATFNVHMWMDGEFELNYQRVLDLVKVRVLIHSINSKHEDLKIGNSFYYLRNDSTFFKNVEIQSRCFMSSRMWRLIRECGF